MTRRCYSSLIQWVYLPYISRQCTCRVQRKFGRRRSSYFPYSSFHESRCFRAQGLLEFLTGMASGTETRNRNHGDFPAPLAAAYLGRQNYKLSGRNSPVQTVSSKFAVPIGGELPWRRLRGAGTETCGLKYQLCLSEARTR